MARRLTDDKLRIILDVEAKGVQATLQQISAETFRLSDANKQMSAEMKDANKQMENAAKTMEKLEKAGKTTSAAYLEAKGTFEAAKAEITDYERRIKENTKAISDNDKQTKELIKTTKLQDLTMAQLKQRAADLQIQLNNTSASLSPEAYKDLQKQLTQVNERMFVVQNSGKSMLSQFAAMHNPVGSAARAIQGFNQGLKLLLANPIVAVIAAAVAVFMLLKDALSKNEEVMNAFNKALAPFQALFDKIINLVMKGVEWIVKFIDAVLSGLSKLAESLPFVGKYFKQFNEDAEKAVQLEKDKQDLQKLNRKNLEEISTIENKIAKIRDEASRRDIYNAKQRFEMLEEAKALELSMLDIKREQLELEISITERELERNRNNTELLDKLAQQKSLLIDIDTEYYNKSRALDRQISAAKIEHQREVADAAKKALEKRLKDEENLLNEQLNKLKESRLQGIITEKEYNKESERLTIESIHRKINIRGQEKDKILQLEAQILDAQYKQQTEADRELLEALNKDKEQKLLLLAESRNAALEILQEQETDQKIYALRAAEIESEFAQMRLDTIRAFGQSVEEAELSNAKFREDAITEANKEIIKSEAENLKEQERLRKIFDRTNAEFNRQYNIRTWEQRKDDELRILKKQHEAGLISEETYRLALKALDKKYEDEKLRIRQQYGLASMKELFNSELELLQENHRLGLIEEEDYQKALLDLKLRYAQEYANSTEEFSKIASDTVKSFAEAETATLSAEYTKRLSNLTEQYNQGIISQADYNAQKEKLDYEQKSKELEINKKYADVNFAMQASEIISSGATAAINAYKALAGIPIVGPALGAAAAALVGITTALKLKQAKAERDRVKAMTLESPGGGSSTPRIGEIRLREGFAEGGYNMSDGGYTKPGGKYEVAGYLPVHGGEYVIASDELKQPEIMNMARAIERERRKRTSKNAVSGMAEGGSNDPEGIGSGTIAIDRESADRIAAVLERLETGEINLTTNYGITEMEAEQRRKMEVESKFTKK